MKKIMAVLLLLTRAASAGLIFDNGTGDKNDTLVIQFCLLDSSGARYTPWDTAYVVQAYGGVDFNTDTLLTPSNYRLNAAYPRNLMFEYRLLAGDGNSNHIGTYTWWTLLVDNNNGSDTHQMHKGWYYVNTDPFEDFLAIADTSVSGPLGKVIRDAVGDSILSIVDNILLNPANRLSSDANGFVVTGAIKDGIIDSAIFAWDYFRAMKRFIWLDSIQNLYINDPGHLQAHTYLQDIKSYTDGDGLYGIDADIGDPSGEENQTRLAWATDDSLGNGSVPDSLIARVDSIRWALGMPMSIAGEKYTDNLHKKIGPYVGETGDNIKDAIDALSLTGGGSEACTLAVRQNGLAPIQGARIVIRTLDQSATRVPGLFTDVNGYGIAELDEASYFISITANNYAPLSDTLVVHRDSTWQFSLTPFDPGNPPSAELCRVYGWVYDIGGDNLANATVSAEIPSDYQPVKYDGIIITPFKKLTESDSTGYWQIDLFPNSLLSKSDSKYLFTIEYPSGVIMKSKVAVPDSISWQFR